jgi:NADH:ubiquinone oxidoreductase subunit E
MEDNLERQLIPYLEPIINQTIEMIEIISKEENFNKSEISKLLNELQENFGEYIHMMSPKTQGRILDINYQLAKVNEVYDLKNSPLNTQPFEEFTK